MKNDRHYTPGAVAERLVAAAQCRTVRAVADFAAGTGDLLQAGSRRWPSARFIGIDTDARALKQLKRVGPEWKAVRADFLNGALVSSRLARMRISSVDLVLLNPPFSARKVKTVNIRLPDGSSVDAGRAIAFVLESLKYCRMGAQILAILPSASRSSVRDLESWRYLESVCDVRFLFSLGHDTFAGCSASAKAFRFTVRRKTPAVQSAPANFLPPSLAPDVMIVRGHVPIHDTKTAGKIRVVHTTDLAEHAYIAAKRFTNASAVLPERPCVLVPRVGKPDHRKICTVTLTNHCLSDCVIALVGRTDAVTHAIKRELLRRWADFSGLYQGTGARYIGVLSVGAFLAERGYTWNCLSRQIPRAAVAAAQPHPPEAKVVAFAS